MPRSIPHFVTVEWIDGPIRICSVGGRNTTYMTWAPWSHLWGRDKKREVDRELLALLDLPKRRL